MVHVQRNLQNLCLLDSSLILAEKNVAQGKRKGEWGVSAWPLGHCIPEAAPIASNASCSSRARSSGVRLESLDLCELSVSGFISKEHLAAGEIVWLDGVILQRMQVTCKLGRYVCARLLVMNPRTKVSTHFANRNILNLSYTWPSSARFTHCMVANAGDVSEFSVLEKTT